MKNPKKHFHISKSSDDINKSSSQTKSFIINNAHKSFNIFEEKNFNQGISKPNFLEEMYLKYSKNLQKYFIKNQTGLKLAGNKYFKNLTVEDYMKQNNLTQEEFISLLNGIYHNEITKDNFFLTPMPNKSRQLLETNKEKNDFLEAERSAVVMRTFEYTRGIKSRVGMRELKKVMEEQKKRLINLMLASASKIQRWWKKKFVIINQNKNNETYQKKIFYYNYMLNKKKAKIFFDKIKNIFKKKKKIKFDFFSKKLNLKAQKSNKKFYTIFDWVKNMKICPQNKFYILKQNKYHLIKKNFGFKKDFFMTKISFGNSQNNLNNNNTFINQIKKIIFLQKMFRHYLRIKKGKLNLKKFINNNNSQFAYFSPNKMIFLYNKNISSEAKEIKSLSKNNNNLYYIQNTKRRANLPNLSPISKNINENDDYLENDNNINIDIDKNYKIKKDIIELKNIKGNKNNMERNNSLQYKEIKSDGNFRIEVRKMSNLSDISNKKNIPIKKIFKSYQNIKRNDNNKKNTKLLFNTKKSNKSTSLNKTKKLSTNKLIYNNMINYDSDNNNIKSKNRYKAKIEKNNLLKNNLLKIEENELSLITTTNNNINNNTSQYNNNLILIDSLEIEKEKKVEKKIKITNPNNSNNNEENEYLEKSFPPELNMDNYQQDSTIDFRDKRIKSNQKTISSSAIYHLDTSDNHIFLNNQIYHESPYPYQILGQIYLNYIHRPLVMKNNYYIEKTNKNIFARDIKNSLIKILNIKNNNFSFAKQISLNQSCILKKYLKQWKYIINKTSPSYIYNKTITSISNSSDNSEKNNFSYYCRINKSNCENDFIFLRISLGYKLIKKILSVKDIKKFLYLLKRRQRRNVSNKKYNYNFNNYSKNDFHLLEFKMKLPVILNKVLIKKYFAIFFHKFLFFAMNLDKKEFFDINNKTCKLIIEGYRKGYFSIMYNIFQIKLNFQYFNTGLKLGNFIQDLLQLK